MSKPKFKNNERVRVVTSDKEKAKIAHKLAVALKPYAGDDGSWRYPLAVYGDKRTYECREDELESMRVIEDEEVVIQSMMDPDTQVATVYDSVYEALSLPIIQGDNIGFYAFFADWLRDVVTFEQFDELIESQLQTLADAHGLDETRRPARIETQRTNQSLDDLRAEDGDIPPEITLENFREWACITFLPGEDEDIGIDGYFDLWILIVEVDGNPMVGYFELEDID